jgi:hypothetical protein
MFLSGELADTKGVNHGVERGAFEAPTQALAQHGEMVAAKQALQT